MPKSNFTTKIICIITLTVLLSSQVAWGGYEGRFLPAAKRNYCIRGQEAEEAKPGIVAGIAGAMGAVAKILDEHSEEIAGELWEGNVDTFSRLLSEALVEGGLQLDYSDFGVAIAWLIKNFPLKKERIINEGISEDTPKYRLVDEKPYEIIRTVLALYDICSRLPKTISPENKAALAKVILSLIIRKIIRNLSGGEWLELASQFVDKVTIPAAQDIAEVLQKSNPRINEVYSDLQGHGRDFWYDGNGADIVLLGDEIVKLAKEQGWYEEDRSFLRHHIAFAYEQSIQTMENFAYSIKEAAEAAVNGRAAETDNDLIEAVKDELNVSSLAAAVIEPDKANRERLENDLKSYWGFDKVLAVESAAELRQKLQEEKYQNLKFTLVVDNRDDEFKNIDETFDFADILLDELKGLPILKIISQTTDIRKPIRDHLRSI